MSLIKTIIFDVDGVLTNGSFIYSQDGIKSHKIFGADDNDAIKLMSKYCDIVFISADKRGLPITKARLKDMGFGVHNISSKERLTQ